MVKRYKDYHLLIILLLTSLVSVYYMPATVNRMIFLVILIAAFRTKQDYVYLVWFFIINDAPGRLFSGGAFDAIRIPLYPVTAGISVSFQELFLILYLFKYVSLKKKPVFLFKKEFGWFLTYGLLVTGYSYLLGMGFDNIVKTFRIFLPWSIIFILPAYVYNRQILVRSCLLLFPVVFFAFLSQIYTYLTGNYIESHLRGMDSFYFGLGDGGFAIRTYSAIYITLFSIIQACYFLFNSKSGFHQSYLALVIFTGFFSVFLTSTRGWIIALTLFFWGLLFLSGFSRNIIKWVRLAAVSAIVFWIIGSQMSIVQNQVDNTMQRLSSLSFLASGDVTAGGTLQRLDVRGPRVMGKFWQSPLMGWGFSNEFFDFADGHVGHHTMLLNVGIAGFLFVNGVFIILCMKIWHLSRRRDTQKKLGKAPLIYVFGLMAIYVIHSSSQIFWGYNLNLEKVFVYGWLFSAINVSFLTCINER